MNDDKSTQRTGLTRRQFFGGSGALFGGAVASGLSLSGCNQSGQTTAPQSGVVPGYEVDPGLIHWRQDGNWAIRMTSAHNLRLMRNGDLVVVGNEGFEAVEIGRKPTTVLPQHSELYYDFVELPDDRGLVAVRRQNLVHLQPGKQTAEQEIGFLGENAFIVSIECDGERLLLTDMGNLCFWALSFDGRVLARWGTESASLNQPGIVVPSPYFDVAVDSQQRIWGVNPGRHRIDRYDADFAVVETWGTANVRTEGFCGCCNPTHLIALQDGSGFLTCEKGIPRIKHYSPEGKLEGVVAPPSDFEPGAQSLAIAARNKGEVFVLNPPARRVLRYVLATS